MRRLSFVQSLSSLIRPTATRQSTDSQNTDDNDVDNEGSAHDALAVRFIVEEFVRTERAYIADLDSIVVHYIGPFESADFNKLIPRALHGRTECAFGNVRELKRFHLQLRLTSLAASEDSVVEIAEKFIHEKANFLRIYLKFISNVHSSADCRRQLERDGRFLKLCQLSASHELALESFLLKPVQRLTKYRLLLEELLRKCAESQKCVLRSALSAVRDVLSEINASMHATRIHGFLGNLMEFKRLCLQAECTVRVFDPKTLRISKVHHRRTLLLFEGGIILCKEKTPKGNVAERYLEHKRHILIVYMGFEECSAVHSHDSFDVWDVRKAQKYSLEVEDDAVRRNVIRKLSEITVLRNNTAYTLTRDASVDMPTSRNEFPSKMRKTRVWRSEAALLKAI